MGLIVEIWQKYFRKKSTPSPPTVAIEILTLDGQQMTRALLRQLRIDCPTSSNGEIQPWHFWGFVRYEFNDGGDLWAIAEHDGTLVRCDISEVAIRKLWDEIKWASAELAEIKRTHGTALSKTTAEKLKNAKFNSQLIIRPNLAACKSIKKLRDMPQLYVAD